MNAAGVLLCGLALVLAATAQEIRTTDGDVFLLAPGKICFGGDGVNPEGFQSFKGEAGAAGPPGDDGSPGGDGRDGKDGAQGPPGKDCSAAQGRESLYMGVVRDAVTLLGAQLQYTERTLAPTSSDTAAREVRVAGLGLGQFANPLLSRAGLFLCRLSHPADGGKAVEDKYGHVRSEVAPAGVYHYVSCTLPEWTYGEVEKAPLAVFFTGGNKEQELDFVGPTDRLTLDIGAGPSRMQLVKFKGEDNVLVTGVGFVGGTYLCIFAAAAAPSVKRASDPVTPISKEQINCGKPPGGLAVKNDFTSKYDMIVAIQKDTKIMPFRGLEGGRTIELDSCFDGVKNNFETDVDCGGHLCAKKCADRASCNVNADCENKNCHSERSQCGIPLTCNDLQLAGTQNLQVSEDNDDVFAVTCDKDGWTGTDVNSGFFKLDTCGRTGNQQPSSTDCEVSWGRNNGKSGDYMKASMRVPSAGFQQWIAPSDGTLHIKAYGASGVVHQCCYRSDNRGGRGGFVEGFVDMKKGDVYTFLVGQKGVIGTRKSGGWGGGGPSYSTGGVGGSSGSGGTHVFWNEADEVGRSPVIPTGNSNDFRILVAGGAGSASTEEGRSASTSRSGGHGGGVTGGWPNTNEGLKAGPGTQTAGGRKGQSGSDPKVTAGRRFYGGQGSSNDAAGGGGGYFGGGGGGQNGGGGGGSGYVGSCRECPGTSSRPVKSPVLHSLSNTANNANVACLWCNEYSDNTPASMRGQGYILFRFQ